MAELRDPRLERRLVSVLALAVATTLASCNNCREPTVVDQPAANLDVKLNVVDVTETPSDNKVIVVMQFLQAGALVKIAPAATASCNGVALTYNALLSGYAERVPIQPVGGSYAFRYSRGGVDTDASVTVPPRPVFAPPTIAGATLPRSSTFTIHYVPGGGTAIRGNASDATNSANNSQPDDGTHDALDVSGFNAGPGTLGITRTLESPIPGTAFGSAASKYDTNKQIAITWQ